MGRVAVAIGALLLGGLLTGLPSVLARDLEDGFDGFRADWDVRLDHQQVKILDQRRNRRVMHSGAASEQIDLEGLVPSARAEFRHAIEPCQVIPELTLSLWVRSTDARSQLGARVVFPYQKDPKTGRALTLIVLGDVYKRVGSWEHLLLKDLDKKIERERPRLRALLLRSVASPQEIDLRSPYVDRVVLQVPCPPGRVEYYLDELLVGPIVPYASATAAAPTVRQVAQVYNDEPPAKPDSEFRLDRLYVGGKPFLPRMLPYHGEAIDDLERSKFNLAWVPELQDEGLMTTLQQHGLRAVATPPHPVGADGRVLDGSQASLAPFGPETSPVLFWNLGTAIPSDEVSAVGNWAEQIRDADRRYRRPLMADVTGSEHSFSRQVPMLSVSLQPLHSPVPFKDYRDTLVERRNLAQPGSFFWTWIHTEPSAEIAQARFADSNPIVVEPEQIRLQLYAALQSGCRGIGFWTQSSLDDDKPGALERKLAIAQLNMELELLEPWLATGSVKSHARFDARLPASTSTNQLSLNFATGSKARKKLFELLSERDIQLRRQAQLGRELDAAMIRTEFGMLLLPVWLSDGGQFCPDQMAANQASILVAGVEETASVWEISTTNIRSLDLQKKRVAGGFQLTLPKFDMTSAVLFTSDRTLVGRLQEKMLTLRQPSAQVSLELAEKKLARVKAVDKQLQDLGVGQPDGFAILNRAAALLQHARHLYGVKDYDGCRLAANDAMQLMRILQHACWHDVNRDLYSPTSTPHAVSYQSLPDHWRLMNRYAASEKTGEPLLQGGDFENFEAVVNAGWVREQNPIEGVQSGAELVDKPHKGQSSLRLAAVPLPGGDAPGVITRNPITVRSPTVPVLAGQIVYVSGWVKVSAPTAGNRAGAQLFDNLAGPTLGLRWTQSTDWQQFGILREVREDGEFQITMTLSGYGDILFDDLQITAHDPSAPPPATQVATPPSSSLPNPIQLLQGLPRFGVKPPAKQ